MSECVPVAPDSTCSPWSTGFFINTSAMSDRYQLTVNTSDTWEKARLNHIRDQRNLILTCGNVDSGLMLQNFNWIVQFHSTKLCLEDIFILSGGCNAFAQRKKSVVSVPCNHVVTSYRRSISTMVDSSGCANTASSETGNYEIAMDMLHSTNEITEFISEWLELVGEGSCIGGVDSDVTSCGFGDPDIGASFCFQISNADSCCQFLNSTLFPSPVTLHALDAQENNGVKPSFPSSTSPHLIVLAVFLILAVVSFVLAAWIAKPHAKNPEYQPNQHTQPEHPRRMMTILGYNSRGSFGTIWEPESSRQSMETIQACPLEAVPFLKLTSMEILEGNDVNSTIGEMEDEDPFSDTFSYQESVFHVSPLRHDENSSAVPHKTSHLASIDI